MSAVTAPIHPPLRFRPERPQDAAAVDRLIGDAFGPGRYAKAAERLREGAAPAPGLSLVAWEGERPVGCVRLWPILIGQAPALLLGPFAVAAANRSRGLGAELVRRACDAAQAAGHGIVLLVGDLAFFERLGFSPAAQVTLPGPADPRRVLWRALRPGALDGAQGQARPAR